jgi:hypothetical protein
MTGPLLRDLADQVRGTTSLVDLVGARVPLKRAGHEMRGCCPFHNEKTPSFYVIERKGFFYCFGCSAHGSAIDLVMRLDQLDFASAVRLLAQEAGLVAGVESARRKPAAEVPRVSPHDIEDERATSIWRQAVPGAGTPVETYLRGRADLTGFSWTRLIEIISLERNPGRCPRSEITPNRSSRSCGRSKYSWRRAGPLARPAKRRRFPSRATIDGATSKAVWRSNRRSGSRSSSVRTPD